ncbi:glycogen/starch/alpha-glucan phosphorylase [uncultured Ferrimonas sp.]|uniref:glycogen/starch/alpha-glucan phosphorylase n=1 Tax=uncultured Ferrimonas sp. TaxID=432640 RepID=UPI0026019F3A|nr:glycogen/starch/alpha-glucan phosphorylase [uncultured Ferrimonas sp.]
MKTPTPLLSESSPLQQSVERQIRYCLSRDQLDQQAIYQSLALSVKEQLMDDWRSTRTSNMSFKQKRVAYLSLEFLMGRSLGNALLNLNLDAEANAALRPYAVALEQVQQQEHDAGLGNGGLGRLAACFLDSCATLELPVVGYGIRYEYGMFSQSFMDGYQQEKPDNWLQEGNPWEIKTPHHDVVVKFFGEVKPFTDQQGHCGHNWVGTENVRAVAYDVPIPGYRNGHINTLRLWRSEATDEFNLASFNQGSYIDAVARKNLAEQITMVLYPNDASENGKELRLRQQYFLSSASLQDLLNGYLSRDNADIRQFAAHHSIQLNDTHPSVSVAELMRLLLDEHQLSWEQAWQITTATLAYTNHTLLPEALERWPVRLFAQMLPRHLQIIYEINARFLELVAQRWPGDTQRLARMSIIEEGPEPQIRMAYLAIVGSFSVNGVAALHTQLLTSGLFQDFYALWPDKFNNKTNGVTPRRWLADCNPRLAALLDQRVGEGWVRDLSRLTVLNALTEDADLISHWHEVKQANKADLAQLVQARCQVTFDPAMMFDVQVKRIHEYKRQLLNILHVIHLYQQVLQGNVDNFTPRCVLLGGKAAPGYGMAKQIIKLANNVAYMVNHNPAMQPYLRMAYLPDYNVSAMEVICPGTDLSEQISTAGKEASGTGNMKFMMNGALTIGTFDGANIEILEEVGEDNFFLFGLRAAEIEQLKPHYDPQQLIRSSTALSGVLQLIESGHFNLHEPGIFNDIVAAINDANDPWMLAADFEAYRQAQLRAAQAYRDTKHWTQMSIRNTAASGRFSSDATISRYQQEIWKTQSRHTLVKQES